MSIILKRAQQVLRTEGFYVFLKQVFSFAFKNIFQYKTYYLIEYKLHEMDEDTFKPKTANVIFKIIPDNKSADEAATPEFDFRLIFADARQRLDEGAVAFIAMEDEKLLHIGWVALNTRAKDSLFQPPYKVDFNDEEACTGGGWTNPGYRSKSICTYVYFQRLQYLRDIGKTIARAAVETGNIPSLKMHSKFGGNVRAKGIYLKILGQQYWKEYPLNIGIGELLEQ
jgi:hypothetical protein